MEIAVCPLVSDCHGLKATFTSTSTTRSCMVMALWLQSVVLLVLVTISNKPLVTECSHSTISMLLTLVEASVKVACQPKS